MPPPSYRPCQFCGQQFGSKSLPIHMNRCKMKPHGWVPATHQNADEPLSAAAKPQQPPQELPKHGWETLDNGLDGALVACRHCGRTFHPERLAKHERVCIEARTARPHVQLGRRRLQDVRPWSVAGSKPQSKWRQQHAEFIAAVQSQRGHGGGGSGATADQHHLAAERPRSRALSTAPGYNRSGLHAAIAPPSRGGLRCHTSASSRCSTAYSQASTAPRHTLASASGEPRAADRPSLSLARREHVASRGDGGGGSLARPKMATRRPTPAQRHATEWYQLEQMQSPPTGAPPPTAAVTRRQLSHHRSPQKRSDAIGALPWPTAVGPAAALHGARQVSSLTSSAWGSFYMPRPSTVGGTTGHSVCPRPTDKAAGAATTARLILGRERAMAR